MKFELKPYNRDVPDEDLIADLKKVARELKKEALTRNEYDRIGKYSEGTLRKRFGGWLNALEKAGLNKTRFYLSDIEFIDELKRIAKFLKQDFVSKGGFKNHSKISSSATISRRFGSWTVALKKAGLNVAPSGRRYSIEDLFENLLNVWTYYGRQPSIEEINKSPSIISGNSYRNRFGNWRKSLEAFVERMSQEDNGVTQILKKEEPEQQIRAEIKEHSAAVENRRGVNLNLHYKVLNRDKFKCVKCGASPATNHNCKLHVDHIVPFSKAGKTVLDNLQTLCENCNLGKGDRLFV